MNEAERACNLFISSSHMLRKEFDERLSSLGLRYFEFKLLVFLEESGPVPMVRAAEEFLMTKAGITLLTDRLEKKALVYRDRCAEDRRVIMLKLTPAGRKLAQRCIQFRSSFLNERLSMLTEEELSQFISIMGKIVSRREELQIG